MPGRPPHAHRDTQWLGLWAEFRTIPGREVALFVWLCACAVVVVVGMGVMGGAG